MNDPALTHTDLSCLDEALCRGHNVLCSDARIRRKVALMELSSGAVKILVARRSPRDMTDGFDFSNYSRFSVNVPLSAGIMESGEMNATYFSRHIIPHIWQFCHDATTHGVTDIYAIATATYRQIANREDILEMIAHDCGLNVAVLSASEEACGVANAVVMTLPPCKVPTIVIDHGKRSTEISLLTPDGNLDVLSLDFGLSHLLNGFSNYPLSEHRSGGYIDTLDKRIECVMREGMAELVLGKSVEKCRVVGLGTPLTLSTGIRGSRNYHGLTLAMSDIEESRSLGMREIEDGNYSEEILQRCIGLAPYLALMRMLDMDCITVSGAALWYGALNRALTLPER